MVAGKACVQPSYLLVFSPKHELRAGWPEGEEECLGRGRDEAGGGGRKRERMEGKMHIKKVKRRHFPCG